MTAQCQACDEPAPQGLSVCNRCSAQAKYHLIDQSAHRIELVTALTRMTRMQAPNDGGRATNLALEWARMGDRFLHTIDGKELIRILNSLPPARKAADALHSQRSLLVSWCRDLNEVHNIPLPPNTVATMSIHLHDHMRILRKHPAGGEFVAELRKLVQDIMRVIDLPAFRRFVVGLCPVVHPGHGGPEECPGQVWAILPASEQVSAVMSCPVCFTKWESHEWTRAGALILRRSERKVA